MIDVGLSDRIQYKLEIEIELAIQHLTRAKYYLTDHIIGLEEHELHDHIKDCLKCQAWDSLEDTKHILSDWLCSDSPGQLVSVREEQAAAEEKLVQISQWVEEADCDCGAMLNIAKLLGIVFGSYQEG